MRDDHISLCLLQERELRQVQIIPRSTVAPWILTKPGKRAASCRQAS